MASDLTLGAPSAAVSQEEPAGVDRVHAEHLDDAVHGRVGVRVQLDEGVGAVGEPVDLARRREAGGADEGEVYPLAVTIRPPFEERAKAATARSISGASRRLIGLTSTPSDEAADWIAPNWPVGGEFIITLRLASARPIPIGRGAGRPGRITQAYPFVRGFANSPWTRPKQCAQASCRHRVWLVSNRQAHVSTGRLGQRCSRGLIMRHPCFKEFRAQERSCALVRKGLSPVWGRREECAWLLNAGYIDGYTGKPPF
jgi:hypothetical protein